MFDFIRNLIEKFLLKYNDLFNFIPNWLMICINIILITALIDLIMKHFSYYQIVKSKLKYKIFIKDFKQ